MEESVCKKLAAALADTSQSERTDGDRVRTFVYIYGEKIDGLGWDINEAQISLVDKIMDWLKNDDSPGEICAEERNI